MNTAVIEDLVALGVDLFNKNNDGDTSLFHALHKHKNSRYKSKRH